MLSPSNVLGRLAGRRHVDEIISSNPDTPGPPVWEQPPERHRNRLSAIHSRDNSLLNLANDSGDNVRRSLSLRSDRPPSRPTINRFASAHETNSPTSPPLSSADESFKPLSPHQRRARGRLSISARSLSQRFKSTDKIPLFTGSEQPDQFNEVPPLPTPSDPSGSFFGSNMLATPSIPGRGAPGSRPSLSNQSSFGRDGPSPYGAPIGGMLLQHASTMNTTSSSVPGAGSHSPSAIYQTIHETSSKRIATIEYMRKVHDGNVYYFGALHHSNAQLSTLPSLHHVKLGRRATNYMILGYSLPMQLDLNSGSAIEYLKALSALLQEFETYQNLVGFDSSGSSLSRGRVGQMFKSGMGLGSRSGKGRRSSATAENLTMDMAKMNLLGIQSDASSPQEHLPTSGHEFEHLLTPHLPFDPDFNTTFATLCDTLVDTYARLLDLVTTPDVCSPSVGDAFTKADKAIRKILVANIVREFEDSTRAGVKSEVAGLGRLVLGGLV